MTGFATMQIVKGLGFAAPTRITFETTGTDHLIYGPMDRFGLRFSPLISRKQSQPFATEMLRALAADPGARAAIVVGKPKPQKKAKMKSSGIPNPALFRTSTANP